LPNTLKIETLTRIYNYLYVNKGEIICLNLDKVTAGIDPQSQHKAWELLEV